MTQALAHRGPDGEGHWISGSVGLGHRRLAILDLTEAGRQPMHSADGRWSITFNGEIYNYLELKADLERQGHRFRSTSDTEVLLRLLETMGTKALDLLDGMFAFAAWDQKERLLYCARDRFGEKPFFYALDKNRSFYFASEIKALFRAGIDRSVRDSRVFSYLAYRAIEDPLDLSTTFFAAVQQLEPGHYLVLNEKGTVQKKCYWDISTAPASPLPSLADAAARYRELFDKSLRRRLRSDVPVGTCLSGGLDSSSIVCTLSRLRDVTSFSQKTFSARMDDPSMDEGKFIEEVTRATGVESHSTLVSELAASGELDKLATHQDEPILSTAVISHWMVMKLAKEHGVTVLIDGQGPDEVLAGYDGYANIFFRELYLSNRGMFEELKGFRDVRGTDFPVDFRFRMEARFPGLLRFFGETRRRFGVHPALQDLHRERVRAHGSQKVPYQRWTDLNSVLRHSTTRAGLPFLLRMCDRSSMAFSREVRLPFLFHELVEFCFSLPSQYKIHAGWSKYLLRRAFEPVLPKAITWRKDKKGFATPQNAWLTRTPLEERVNEAIAFLQREKWIAKPDPSKSWEYLSTASWLKNCL